MFHIVSVFIAFDFKYFSLVLLKVKSFPFHFWQQIPSNTSSRKYSRKRNILKHVFFSFFPFFHCYLILSFTNLLFGRGNNGYISFKCIEMFSGPYRILFFFPPIQVVGKIFCNREVHSQNIFRTKTRPRALYYKLCNKITADPQVLVLLRLKAQLRISDRLTCCILIAISQCLVLRDFASKPFTSLHHFLICSVSFFFG